MAKYKMSPNEIARLLQDERNRKRKERLILVRDQAKARAAAVRNAVKSEKDHQLDILALKTEGLLNDEKYEQVIAKEEELVQRLNTIGHGHRDANEQEPRHELISARKRENERRAEERHTAALRRLRQEQEEQDLQNNRHILARQTALEIEKDRAAKVAAMPAPLADPIDNIGPFQMRPVQIIDGSAYSTTYYHITDQVHAEKAEQSDQLTACEAAGVESERMKELDKELKREKQEQKEKARVRHENAREKELIRQDYANMLHEMSDLQRESQRKRQHKVAKIPKQIFIPPSLHILENQQHQSKVAQAFEDMYMAATDHMGDISVALSNQEPYQY